MKFLGIIEGKGLYAEWNDEYKQIRYNLDGEEIAVFDMKKMRIEDKIIFRENTLANELSAEAKDMIQTLARDIDLKELQEQEKDLEDYRNTLSVALDIDEEDLISYTEIDIEEKEESKENVTKNEKEQEKLATTKDINIKQELSMDAMATSTKSIGRVLRDAGKIPNVPGKNFVKLGIVESDKVKNIDKDAKTNTTRFAFVAISTDGTVAPVNLEQDHQEGNNPREIGYRTKADGGVEQDDVNSRYKIGNNGETISVKTSNGPGELEVGYSAHKTLGGEGIDGNESVDHQLETKSVYWKPRKDSRDQEYADGIRGTEEKVREAHLESAHNKKLKQGTKGKVGDNDEYKNTDGKEETKESHHDFDYIERARKLMSENEEVADVFTEEEVVEMLKKSHNGGKEIEKAEEDIKEDANMLKSHNR